MPDRTLVRVGDRWHVHVSRVEDWSSRGNLGDNTEGEDERVDENHRGEHRDRLDRELEQIRSRKDTEVVGIKR